MLRFVLLFSLLSAFFLGCAVKHTGLSEDEKIAAKHLYVLEIDSSPARGMDVLIDGTKRGQTPLTVVLQPHLEAMLEVSNGALWGFKKVTAGTPGEKGQVVIKATKTLLRVSYLKGGSFMMGRSNGSFDERPEHEVFLDDFFMGQHEVTNGQFSQFVRQTGYKTDATKVGSCWVFQRGLTMKVGVQWKNIPLTGAAGNNPVTCVSWNDALEYARWISKKTGREFRLPTEAEWEYAALGGGATSGVPPSQAEANLNFCDKNCDASWAESGDDGFSSLAPVKSYKPNKVGLFDMAGNVWEWCGDGYGQDYYQRGPVRNPLGDDSTFFKVVRGGSWLYPAGEAAPSNRSYFKQTFRSTDVGFRLVLVP